jgi:hypothetical protein
MYNSTKANNRDPRSQGSTLGGTGTVQYRLERASEFTREALLHKMFFQILDSTANFTFLIFLVSQVLMDSSCERTSGSSQNFWMGPPRSRGSSVPAIALISAKKIAYFLMVTKFPVLYIGIVLMPIQIRR